MNDRGQYGSSFARGQYGAAFGRALYGHAAPTYGSGGYARIDHAQHWGRASGNGRGQYGARIGAAPPNSIEIPTSGKGYDNILNAQLVILRTARGSGKDTVFPYAIPHTTNEDVRLLKTYWTKAIADTKAAKRAPGLLGILSGPIGAALTATVDVPGDLGNFAKTIKAWRIAADDVNALASTGDDQIYVKNPEFWHALATLAIELSNIMEAPTAFDIGLHSTLHYIAHPVEGFEKTYEEGKKISLDVLPYALIGAGVIGAVLLVAAVKK